jgi:hypothetical protein
MRFLLSLVFLCFAIAAHAAPTEVPLGSELRAHLFDLARSPAVRQAGRPVKFAGSLKQLGNWAFFNGHVVDSAGQAVLVGDVKSSDTVALWKQTDSKWSLVKCHVGVTDVCFLDWPLKLGVPRELLFGK